MKRKVAVLITFLLFTGRIMAHGTVYPKDLTVSQDGSGQYKTIQEAVNAVRDISQQIVTIDIKKAFSTASGEKVRNYQSVITVLN